MQIVFFIAANTAPTFALMPMAHPNIKQHLYGPLAPGMTSNLKFADDFLKTVAVPHLSWPHS